MMVETTRRPERRARALMERDIAAVVTLVDKINSELEAARPNPLMRNEEAEYARKAIIVLKTGIEEISGRKPPFSMPGDEQIVGEFMAAFTKKYSNWMKDAFPDASVGRNAQPEDILKKLDSSKEFSAFEKRLARSMLAMRTLSMKLERYEAQLGAEEENGTLAKRLGCGPESVPRFRTALERFIGDKEKILEKVKEELKEKEEWFSISGNVDSFEKSEYASEWLAIVAKSAHDLTRTYRAEPGEEAIFERWQNGIEHSVNAWLGRTFPAAIESGRGTSLDEALKKLAESKEFSNLEKRFMAYSIELRGLNLQAAQMKKLAYQGGGWQMAGEDY